MTDTLWEHEEISDNCILFRRVHSQLTVNLKPYEVPPSAFKNKPVEDPNLSTHWNRHITAEDVRVLISKEYKSGTQDFKDSNKFFILSVLVKKINDLNSREDFSPQEVKHTPKQTIPEIIGFPNDRSHSSILGNKTDEEVRVCLSRIAEWSLHPFSI